MVTVGAGLYLAPAEKDQLRQNAVIRQLIEGRSNAVGSLTLTHDGTSTATTVVATVCGPNSAVFLSPQTANAASARPTTYVSSVTPGQFIVSHSSTASTDVTFWFVCLG